MAVLNDDGNYVDIAVILRIKSGVLYPDCASNQQQTVLFTTHDATKSQKPFVLDHSHSELKADCAVLQVAICT
eukprot:208276-Pleurochrysis_carterae.AAC.14